MTIQFKLLMAAKTPKSVYTVKPQLSRTRLSGIFDYPDLPLRPLLHKYQSVTFDICSFLPIKQNRFKETMLML